MRLTNSAKDTIIARILEDTFSARAKEICGLEAVLATDVYNDFYSPHAKAMASLPETFFLQCSTLTIKLEGERHSHGLNLQTTKKFAACHNYGDFKFAKDHWVTQAWQSIAAKRDELDSDKSTLRATLRATLMPITTDKKLLEVWPEAAQHIPRGPAVTENLPAVNMDNLNEMIAKMKGGEK